MANQKRGKYASKHPAEVGIDPDLAEAIRSRQEDGRLSCGAASQIATTFKVPMAEVGRNADLVEARIDRCILGLFGFEVLDGKKRRVEPAKEVSSDMKRAIRNGVEDGRLTCKASWEIAARLGESRYSVSQAAEALNIKISKCQLGAF